MTTPTQGEHAQTEALFYASALENCAEVDFDRIFVPAAAVIRRLHAQVAALTAQPAAPQGVAYAELPEPIWRTAQGVAFSERQLYDFADRTHALRASNGQAPATQQAGEVALDAAMRAIQQAIGLIGEPDSDRLRAVRRVLRGAVIVVEDNAPQPSPEAQPAPAAGAVAGWQMVPVELDAAMHTAMDRAFSDAMHVGVPVSPEAWAAALATAPTPAAQADSQPAPVAAFEVADALADSQYLAGVSAGWNAANADDPNAALQKLHESRAGYLKPLSAARDPADSVLEDAARLLRQILAASQDGDSDTHLSAHFVSRIETITKPGGAA